MNMVEMLQVPSKTRNVLINLELSISNEILAAKVRALVFLPFCFLLTLNG